jgi:hypothetical protein
MTFIETVCLAVVPNGASRPSAIGICSRNASVPVPVPVKTFVFAPLLHWSSGRIGTGA